MNKHIVAADQPILGKAPEPCARGWPWFLSLPRAVIGMPLIKIRLELTGLLRGATDVAKLTDFASTPDTG